MSAPRWYSARDWPLPLQLTGVMIVVAAIVWPQVTGLNADAVESQSIARETQHLERRATAAARRLEERVGRLRAYVELLAQNPALGQALHQPSQTELPAPEEVPPGLAARQWDEQHPQVYDLLTSLRRANPWFSNVYLLDPSGVCIATSERRLKPEMIGRSYDYRPYFQAAVDDRIPFVTDLLKNANSPGTAIFVSAPVLLDQRVAAVVVLKVDAGALHEVVTDLAQAQGGALLVDRFGVVVSDAWTGSVRSTEDPHSLQFHPFASVARFSTLFAQTRRYGTPPSEHYLDRIEQPLPLDALWQALQQQRSGADEYAVPSAFAGPVVATMVGYAPVITGPHEPYGYIVVGESAEEFRTPLRQLRRQAHVRSGLAILAVMIIFALFIRRFSKRVDRLAHAVRRRADGETDVPLSVDRHDELGRLAHSVQRLAEHAHTSVAAAQQARHVADQARDRAQALARSRAHAITRACTVLDEARRAIEGGDDDPSGRMPLQGAALDLAALSESTDALHPRRSRVDVSALVDDILKSRPNRITERIVECIVEGAPHSPPAVVHSDPAMLRRILEHLIDNADKFTRSGHVKVHVRTLDHAVDVTVADTGIGLTARQAARVSATSDEPVGPHGIGLWVSGRLARALGASLHATAEVGQGTTVTLTIPSPDPDLVGP